MCRNLFRLQIMTPEFIEHLSKLLGSKIVSYKPVTGGDISQAFLLELKDTRLFLKLNSADLLPMFQAEQKGLKAIRDTNTLTVPKVLESGSFQQYSYLIMEYIEHKPANEAESRKLGTQLAAMHQHTHTLFGWEQDNYIGSLSQSNTQHTDWGSFYLTERIMPQLQLAATKGIHLMDEKQQETMYKVCSELFFDVKPSLLHGDLWGGNYLVTADGTPYLIDPAVYYGHYEVDLAMTRLFGGFSSAFYESYYEICPPQEHQQERIEIYQLYYLLVHLNLFGDSYYHSVKRILDRYFL